MANTSIVITTNGRMWKEGRKEGRKEEKHVSQYNIYIYIYTYIYIHTYSYKHDIMCNDGRKEEGSCIGKEGRVEEG
jgi:hypothetical protein